MPIFTFIYIQVMKTVHAHCLQQWNLLIVQWSDCGYILFCQCVIFRQFSVGKASK